MKKMFIGIVMVSLLSCIEQKSNLPHPEKNPESTVMLAGKWVPNNPNQIDFESLPRVPSEHAVISDVRDMGGTWVNQHGYLAYFNNRFWAMWSDGPGVQQTTPDKHRNVMPGHDQAGTRVSFSTSPNGLNWSTKKDLSGPPAKGFGWIARGFWEREGKLLALASHFNAPGYTGEGLSLEAFSWDEKREQWQKEGTVLDDALNNFPPKKLPNGQWMMSRRDHNRNVTVMVGGTDRFDSWQVIPVVSYKQNEQRPEEPCWYILPKGKNIVGLFRDNSDSKRLMRAFSTDNGQTWSNLVRTDFPDARSKFFVVKTSKDYYALVSNPNPHGRDPLTLSISRDGLIFTHMFYLVGGRHIDYPHMIEQDGILYISFSGAKQTLEVLKVNLDHLDSLKMPSEPLIDPLKSKANYISDWWIIGPFDNSNGHGLETSYAPETKFDVNKIYKGSEGQDVKWELYNRNENGYFDFTTIFHPSENGVAYAARNFKMDDEKTVKIGVGSNDGIRMWLNGNLVLDHKALRKAAPNQEILNLPFKKGDNLILIKVDQFGGGWGLYFALLDKINEN